MTKLENEAELVKEALRVGMNYAEKRGVAKFEQTDSANDRLEYVYRLLVHDKRGFRSLSDESQRRQQKLASRKEGCLCRRRQSVAQGS